MYPSEAIYVAYVPGQPSWYCGIIAIRGKLHCIWLTVFTWYFSPISMQNLLKGKRKMQGIYRTIVGPIADIKYGHDGTGFLMRLRIQLCSYYFYSIGW